MDFVGYEAKIPCRNKFEDMFEVYGLKASENKINTMKKLIYQKI